MADSNTRSRVYVHCRPIFAAGNNAQLRRQKKVKELINGNRKSLKPLLKDIGEGKVVDIVQDLLKKDIFASELRAKVEFPTLFRSSPSREAQRQASEIDATRSTAEVLEEIASQDGERHAAELVDTYPPADTSEPEELGTDDFLRVPAERRLAQERLPSLYPSYLPYQTQHLILNTAQRVLEECCFDFAKVSMPFVLQEKGWECPSAVELTQWVKLLRSKKSNPRLKYVAVDHDEEEFPELLTRVSNLRHTAVHRLPTTARGISQLLESSVKFAQSVNDNLRAAQLEGLLMSVDSQIQALELYKNVLEDTASRKLAHIQRKREELDRMETELIAGMLKDDKDRKLLIGQILKESVHGTFAQKTDNGLEEENDERDGQEEDCVDDEDGDGDRDGKETEVEKGPDNQDLDDTVDPDDFYDTTSGTL